MIVLIPISINEAQVMTQSNIFALRIPLEPNSVNKIKLLIKKYYSIFWNDQSDEEESKSQDSPTSQFTIRKSMETIP